MARREIEYTITRRNSRFNATGSDLTVRLLHPLTTTIAILSVLSSQCE